MSVEELKIKVDNLKSGITEKATRIVHQQMPAKVIHLNEIFTKFAAFNVGLDQVAKPLTSPHTAEELATPGTTANSNNTNTRKRKIIHIPSSETPPIIHCNGVILSMLDVLKAEILELIETISTVKIWIQLNIPRIEDGNNFGVSIQEETVNELGRAEDSGFSVLENMTKYFITRAKLVSKVLKHRNIYDYQQSIIELDEKEWINLRLCCLDLRNNYAILHDMIIKNLEKIKTPRSSNHLAAIF